MTITKPGREILYPGTCPVCSCEFTVTQKECDLQELSKGSRACMLFCHCPNETCGTPVKVAELREAPGYSQMVKPFDKVTH